ncbi:MAG: hypothetical protein WA746_04145, partial [Isosphaeraceae bacterium]
NLKLGLTPRPADPKARLARSQFLFPLKKRTDTGFLPPVFFQRLRLQREPVPRRPGGLPERLSRFPPGRRLRGL